MGARHFQIKDHLRRNGVVAFSSNYALYGIEAVLESELFRSLGNAAFTSTKISCLGGSSSPSSMQGVPAVKNLRAKERTYH